MDYGASNGARQQHHQYASFGGYDPAPPYDAPLYAYGQQHHPHAYRPSAYHQAYQPPHPPPPPGTDHSDRPTHVQIYASEVFNGVVHPAAHQEYQRWFSGHSVGLGTTPQPMTVRTLAAVAAAPTKQPRGESAHRGGGRRGRGTFRSGRGRFGYRASKQDVGAPPLHDRVQGCKDNDGSQNHHSVDVQLPVTATTAITGSMSALEPNQGKVQEPALAIDQQSMAPSLPILPFAWCDVCRVDCNSLQVLEQHKNGKRHKKTLQRMQQIQAQQKLMVGLQAEWTGESGLFQNAEIPVLGEVNIFPQMGGEKVVTAGEICAPAFLSGKFCEGSKAVAFSGTMTSTSMVPRVSEENIVSTSAVTAVSSEVKGNIHSAAAENLPEAATREMDHKLGSGVPTQTVATPSDCSKGLKAGDEAPASATPDDIEVPGARMSYSDKRRGTKRKMWYWRDGKRRLRKSQARGSRNQERPRDRARICTLCNITCDAQAVFECHLSGKKHLSRIKRFQGQNTIFGLLSAYVPPNQLSAPPRDPEPLFYGLKTNEIFQQEPSPPEAVALDSQSQLRREQHEGNTPTCKEPSPPEVVASDSHSRLHREQHEGNTPASEEASLPEVVASDSHSRLHREQHEGNTPASEEPSPPEVSMISQSELHREQHEVNTPTSEVRLHNEPSQ